jgi:hypothetical protein
MNAMEKSLKAVDELFANTTAEEFEKDYLACESGVGITIEDFLEINKENSNGPLIFTKE